MKRLALLGVAVLLSPAFALAQASQPEPPPPEPAGSKDEPPPEGVDTRGGHTTPASPTATAQPPPTPSASPTSTPTSTPTPTSTSTSTPTEPEEEGPSGRDIVAAYNAGFHWGLSPGVFFPSGGGNPGFMMTVDFRYGFDLGSVILAPGLRVAGIFPSGVTAVLSAALLRLTFPLGHFGPFIEAGAGPGYLSDPKHTGLNVYSGIGAMYYFSEHFGLGVVASYEKLLGSELGLFGVGPALMIAF